jgi:hypothetical protein
MAWRHSLAAGGAILWAAAANPAVAWDRAAGSVAPAAPPIAAAAEAPAIAGAGEVLADADLADAEQSGRGDVAISLTDQDLTAISTGNTITAGVVGSGSISMSDAALSDFNGIGNFTFNTGHNNTLQSSMSVSVIVTP